MASTRTWTRRRWVRGPFPRGARPLRLCTLATVIGLTVALVDPVNGWQTTWIGDLYGHAQLISIAPQGDIVAVGDEYDDGAVLSPEFALISLSRTGGARWRVSIQGSGAFAGGSGRGAAFDSSGDVFAVGTTWPATSAGGAFTVVKVSGTDGAQLWRRDDVEGCTTSAGGHALAVNGDDDVVVGGAVRCEFGTLLVRKLNGSTGAAMWTTRPAGPHPFSNNEVVSLLVDAQGDVLMVGRTSEAGWETSVVAKLRGTDGALLWQSSISLRVPWSPHAVAIDSVGDITIGGKALGDGVIVRLRGADGVQLWRSQPFGSSSISNGVAVDGAGDVITAGHLFTDRMTLAVLKLSGADGAEVWRHTMPAIADGSRAEAAAVTVDGAGDAVAVGSYGRPSGVVFQVTKLGGSDGVMHWIREVGGDSTNDFGVSVAIGADDLPVAAGRASAAAAQRGLTVLGFGALGQLDTDTDTDGIFDDVENAIHDTGDGNGDGISDSAQANVASLPAILGGDFVTLTSSAGTAFSNVRALNQLPPDVPTGVLFPVKFTLSGLPSSEALVNMRLPPGTNPLAYYKFGGTPADPIDHWYDFTFDGTTGSVVTDDTIALHFVDGERGDADLVSNDSVSDPGAPVSDPNQHDLAITKIGVPKTLTTRNGIQRLVRVMIQNRAGHAEVIEAADLGDGVTTGLVRLIAEASDGGEEGCAAPVVSLATDRNAKTFSTGPRTLLSKQKLTVFFRATYSCTAPAPRGGIEPGDYRHFASVHREAIDGEPDAHPADDKCPRIAVTPPYAIDPYPNGRLREKGCGAKRLDGTLGASVVVDVIAQ